MKIKKPRYRNNILTNVVNISNKRSILIIGVCFAILSGILMHYTGISKSVIKPALSIIFSIPLNSAKSLMVKTDHIYINIEHKNYQKLVYKRQIALKRGILISDSDDYVPTEITHNGKTVKADIRLKGDYSSHLKGDKWSFRIKVKGDDTIFGMKRSSIHHPKQRHYIYEWLFHEALKREDVISLRYKFIDVTLNGKNLGIYALEEHFDKRLLEHNQRREGPIIRFSEELFWNENTFPSEASDARNFFDTETYLGAEIDPIQSNITVKDPALLDQFEKAAFLLDNFRKGELKTSEVFDIVTLSKFLAISDLFGAHHATRWHNKKFYYNPITAKLEPIGFDGYSGDRATITLTLLIYNHRQKMKHQNSIFQDNILLKTYIEELENISRTEYLDDFLSDVKEKLNQNMKILHSEFRDFSFNKNILFKNQAYIRNVLNPVKGLHAYYKNYSEDEIELLLVNIQFLPIEILNVSLNDLTIFKPTNSKLLPPKLSQKPTDFHLYKFKIPRNAAWSNTLIKQLNLNYRLLGTSKVRHVDILPWNYLDNQWIENDVITNTSTIDDFDFLLIDKTTNIIFFKSGKWELKNDLIIPKGYRVFAKPGLKIDFLNSAKIISSSPFSFIGSDENPIVLYSSDSTGQGIIAINVEQESLFEHVYFNNLSNPSQRGMNITGAVTFYKSPVKITHCYFDRNKSEDALNIIRTKFTIENTFFNKTYSDALDVDSSNGKIKNTSFFNSGNDAIDLSDSIIELNDIFINKVGDKGISAGENSQINARHIEIKNAEIAVASKDLSNIKIKEITISDSKIGLSAYQKKSEFGPGNILVNNLLIRNVEIPYLIESGSNITIDGNVVESNSENVKDILYGTQYGKSSK